MTEARRFQVTGYVQAVGFRWATQQEAQRLGLVGTVRNLDDGSVLVEAAGSPRLLRELERWLQRGPRWARVTGVTAEPIAAFTRNGFDIIG